MSLALDPTVCAAALLAAIAYLAGVRRLRRQWLRRRTAAFLAGLIALAALLAPGLHAGAERSLSLHMLQHLGLTAVVAPLLVAGSSLRLALGALRSGSRRQLARTLHAAPARTLARPAVAFGVFALVMLVSHVPVAYGLALEHPALHELQHAVYLGAALVFWMPLLGADPLPRRPSAVGRLAYLMLAMPAMAVVGLALILSREPLYPHYVEVAGAAAALADQRLAGTLMWVGGAILMGAVAVAMGWSWLAAEHARTVAAERLARRSRATAVTGAVVAATAVAAAPALAQPSVERPLPAVVQAAPAPRPATAHERPRAVVQAAPGQPTTPAVERGRRLFAEACSSCHGLDARGVAGRGPTLHGAGALAADFYLSTGRMPLASPRDEPLRAQPAYQPAQVDGLVAFVGSLGGPPVPSPRPERGDVEEGFRQFTSNCAGCHQVLARGGIVTGAIAPSLQEATPRQIAEAVRVGPYVMPHFPERQISDDELDSIIRYVLYTRDPADKGGWGIGHLGPIPEGMVAWLLGGVALLVVVRLIGERAPR